MKRELEEDTCISVWIPTLPIELYVEIARASDWVLSGPLARCSHAHLRLFTSPMVLLDLMQWIKSTPERRLLPWLCFALPASLMRSSHAREVPPAYVWEMLHKLLAKSNDFLLTGGAVCSQLYGRHWVSDVDVFVPHEATPVADTRCILDVSCMMLDLVPSWSSEIQYELDCFDMSIVQQGFTRDGTLYRTPISLYTQDHDELIAFPDEANVFYNTTPHYPAHDLIKSWSGLWHDINEHDTPEQRFHEWGMTELTSESATYRWCNRVKKYCERFYLFDIAYCRPPVRRRWPCLVPDPYDPEILMPARRPDKRDTVTIK